jgi:hypothetical protein
VALAAVVAAAQSSTQESDHAQNPPSPLRCCACGVASAYVIPFGWPHRARPSGRPP